MSGFFVFSYLCPVKKAIITIALLFLWITSFAQTRKMDSTLVTFYPSSFDSISLNAPSYIDTSTFHANNFDLLDHDQTIYSTLSNIGMAHKSMRFSPSSEIGFDMELPAFDKYIKTQRNLKTYLSLLPYSEIRYVMTISDKEQHLNFKFGRQVFQGLHLSFEYNINYSPANFNNNAVENNYFWINALYTTKNQHYRALAYWFRNKIEVQENGGIVYDSVYVNHQESDNTVILTNLNNATNYIKVSGAGLQHYLVTWGRINHTFTYQRNQLFFNETSADSYYYLPFDTLLNTKTTDTTIVQAFHNSLSWNSLGSQDYSNAIPFYVYAGVDYDYFKVKRYDYLEEETINDQSHSQVNLNGGVIVNLFNSTTVTGKAKVILAGYQIGNFNIDGQWRQYLGNTERNWGKLTVDFNMRRKSPTWFETSYISNHFRWENDFHAATYLMFGAHYQYKSYNIGVKHTTINDLIYFNQQTRPAQYDGFASVTEVHGSFTKTLWRFQFEGFACLNLVSNHDILRLPTFLGKLKIGYAQPIFRHAAVLHPSITVHYFTKYYADAYMPALRTFYLQDDVMIGNYPNIDLALAINVKQADIYLQYSNMFLLTGNRDSFVAPHYPMRDSKFFIGINWRLFN